MNIGTSLCLMLSITFFIFAIIFLLLKDKGAILVSGFNTLTKEERSKYNQVDISKDMRNNFFIWSFIFIVGALFSYLVSEYMAIIAFAIWLILFLKDVHLDVYKAFDKYKL